MNHRRTSPADFYLPPFSFHDSAQPLPELPDPDVLILTSDGLRIPAHSSVLATVSPVLQRINNRPLFNQTESRSNNVVVSPVLESIINRPLKRRSSERVIPILGVPGDAVSAFIRFLYFSRCTEEQLDKYGIHLLALSHVFLVRQLKQKCSKGLIQRLTIENVVDVLQLAKWCDAPNLYLKCLKLVANHLEDVEKTEGWKFLQDHDPWLELEILQFLDEADLRKKKTRKYKAEQNVYLQLSEAMECLEHICTEGCTSVGPHDIEPTKKREPCSKFSTCQGLQLLIQHFASCKKRVNGGSCSRCKRMWQLLRLHSSICDQPDSCKVPLCRQFMARTQLETGGVDARWRLLVRKVLSAKTLSALSLSKRKREEEPKEKLVNHGIRSLTL